MNITKLFNILLDVSGIGLGIFLVFLGRWGLKRRFGGRLIWGVVIFLGISAFLIHFFRYFGLGSVRHLFGL